MSKDDVRAALEAAEPVAPMAEDFMPDDPDAGLPRDPAESDDPHATGAGFELNDFGNGLRMAHYYGENLCHVPRLGWFRWDGQRWIADEDALAVRIDAQNMGARIVQEIPFLALQEWERAQLERWHAVRREYYDLSARTAPDEADRARLAHLEALKRLCDPAIKSLAAKRKAHQAHAKASGNTSKISNMIQEAAPRLRVDVSDLNANPDMVNTLSGVLHFRQVPEDAADVPSYREPGMAWAVDLLPHDRSHKITKMIAAHYEPAAPADAPVFRAFLERVQPDPEIRAFLQAYAGYSLLGRTDNQSLLFNYGIGRNGKSTLVDTLARIFADYGTTLPIESLTGTEQRKGSEATPDLVRLPGARFVRASEPEQGTQMKEALIKALTGGEDILIRRMHAEFIEVKPEFKLWISGNHKPEIRGADDGIWRRVKLVPWPVQIPDDEVDPELPRKLMAERDGILAWMVAGALDYLNGRMIEPEAVRAATKDYRQSSDPMREFLMTECEVTADPADRVTAPHLRDAFNAWRLAQAESTWTANTISRQVGQRAGVIKSPLGNSYERQKSNGQTYWTHLRLKPDAVSRIEEFSGALSMINARGK